MAESLLLLHGQRTFPHDPTLRGYRTVYRENELNRCPGCGGAHWYVGRSLAECAFCSTALPLQEAGSLSGGFHTHNNRPVFFQNGRGAAPARLPRSRS